MEINESPISENAFGQLIDTVQQSVEDIVKAGVERPTQFEILTAAAFLFFKEQGVDYAVIEVGLGGLLDSTNVITPVVSVITNVTIDHQAYCGNTVEEIATHKAGIIKEGIPVVTAAQEQPLHIIEDKANAMHAPLYVFNKKFGIDSRSAMKGGQMITVSAEGVSPAMLFTSMAGIHQAVNLACAYMAVQIIMANDDTISEETMREGFARAKWAGRFEIMKYNNRTIILDGAHNAAGAESFSMTYDELFKNEPKALIMAVLDDKDRHSIIRNIVKGKDRVYTVPAPTPRSTEPTVLGTMIGQDVPGASIEVCSSVTKALEKALAHTSQDQVIVVCGSLYILGEARHYLLTQDAAL